jgi:tetratricopeptide (TPR) repeat protein
MRDANAMRIQALVHAAARARESGDFPKALAVASEAAREKLAHPLLLRIQAEALAVAGRFPEAGAVLNQALALDPRDAFTIVDIGRVLVAEDRVDEAIPAFEAALSARPDLAEAWIELGSAREITFDDARARAAYEKAGERAPRDPRPWAALASIAIRSGDYDRARSLAAKTLGLQADNVAAGLVLAGVDLQRRAFDEARVRVEDLLAHQALDERQQQLAYSLLGDVLDGLGRAAEAFAAYSRMNEVILRTHAARFGPGGPVESHFDFVQRLTRWFERQDPVAWRLPVRVGNCESPVRRHVFLLGYMRSGTTLVENILASLPGVRTLEERPTLTEADFAFLRNDASLDQLTNIDPATADRLRAAYWQRVRAELPDVDGTVFVDKGPLNGIKLPVIARLFPDALVVRCRRDPRDVVLSCFRRHFRVNASTYQTAQLDTAARHFDVVTRLTERHLDVLPLPVHVVDYAALVADFDGTTRALADFVGVPWTEDARGFSRTASERGVRTASAPQVRRGLFDGTGQWLKYRTQMAPVLPLLEPWVARFGCTAG